MVTWTPQMKWMLVLTILDTMHKSAFNWDEIERRMGYTVSQNAMR